MVGVAHTRFFRLTVKGGYDTRVLPTPDIGPLS